MERRDKKRKITFKIKRECKEIPNTHISQGQVHESFVCNRQPVSQTLEYKGAMECSVDRSNLLFDGSSFAWVGYWNIRLKILVRMIKMVAVVVILAIELFVVIIFVSVRVVALVVVIVLVGISKVFFACHEGAGGDVAFADVIVIIIIIIIVVVVRITSISIVVVVLVALVGGGSGSGGGGGNVDVSCIASHMMFQKVVCF